MRFIRNPVTQFLLIGVLTIVGVAIGTNYLADDAALDEAVEETRRTTEVLATSVAEPSLPDALYRTGDHPGAVDRMDREILSFLLVNEVVRVIIRDTEGRIIYSSVPTLIGKRRALDEDRQRVLTQGGSGSQFSESENLLGGPIEGADSAILTYAQILKEDKPDNPLLFETYYPADEVESRAGEIFGSFRWIALVPIFLLILPVLLILRLLTQQLNRAAKERERLLRSAIDASDAERRRIARDLHDGVVQELAGTAFSVSALVRDAETSDASRTTLQAASVALRDSLKSLRSLLAEIHPPELHPEGLPAALDDLIAPAAAAGIQASVSIEGVEGASDAEAALVWRVAQEAVRNTLRHSGATTLAVTVRGDGEKLSLGVVDDGSGFDPEDVVDPHRYGLRGLRSLVRDVGGELEVISAPGEGTTVRMEVDIA